jgi:predicted  nucleic acid-binding Zn-ribbon protein
MAFSGEYMVPIQDAQKLERELAEVTKQRDALAEALKSLCRAIISEETLDITDLFKQSEAAIAAVEGGSHE